VSHTEAKNHALVLRDAPIRATAQRIINSAFGCAGERCMALPVLAVEEPMAEALVAAIVELAGALEPVTFFGYAGIPCRSRILIISIPLDLSHDLHQTVRLE
jgi:delta 1-pyrroline-5-carboxylate dehydrogenase